ncbi:uncharacterized protein HMPREF1541_02178 [Cyphellophora europaea CBS 101466]|uniref:AB hydrolase-1 domain-containing protein n=1 Tax=Cyphellophora europaea (strain CBS 101466) TaxID=1220924 RepID=W2S343_CYPE1|nr:uncharacterized protein HMPREF1541_02178 [Cyphellophora europaea CBS 101466]ETN43020.1 hypothetical protein HMPREF1541_02178 [Cyphellophora europaea CBS 101466]
MATTIVFVPGAWHRPEIWSRVTSLLPFKTVCPALPTTTGSGTFKDDIDAVRAPIQAEIASGNNVVVVAHSYGSVPASSALRGLTSGSPRVIGFIGIATGWATIGKSFNDAFEGKPPPIWEIKNGLVELTIDPRELFYHDVDDADQWVAKLDKQSAEAFDGGEHVYPGWKEVPAWYLATIEDRALPFQAQMMFVRQAQAEGDVTIREIAASHSPMLSKPKETADFIQEAVRAFQKS